VPFWATTVSSAYEQLEVMHGKRSLLSGLKPPSAAVSYHCLESEAHRTPRTQLAVTNKYLILGSV